MVLNIAIIGENNKTIISKLLKYYKENEYKVCTVKEPLLIEVKYILNNYDLTSYEKSLLQAFNNSIKFQNYNEYDIVFWNRTPATDYIENNDLTLRFIQQINRYTLKMDYTILITDENYSKLKKAHKNLQIIKNKDYETIIKEITRILDENLPRCKFCGHIFKKTQKHKKYCSTDCSDKAFNDQCRENNREFYKKYKGVLSERQKGQLGSKNANLHANSPNLQKDKPNFFKELETIRNAKKSLGLKKK